MSDAISISITDRATPQVKRLIASLHPHILGEIVFPPVLELTQQHLTAYKNTKGFPSTGFGEQLADKSYGTATDQGAKIIIHGQGAQQLLKGGTIRPVNKKMLCFGITADSYGKSLPEMFGGPIPPRKQRTPEQKATLKTLRSQFAFAPEVTQEPHPDLIPSTAALRKTSITAIEQAIEGGFHA